MVATGYRRCFLKMLFWEAQFFQTAFMAHISGLNKNKCHHQRKHENTGGEGCLLLCLLKWVNLSFTARENIKNINN